jgi:hypothetical protein
MRYLRSYNSVYRKVTTKKSNAIEESIWLNKSVFRKSQITLGRK